MSMLNIESRARFEDFPTETIFNIFEYLTSDEIIYGFSNLNQRLNNVLLNNEFYFKSLVFPNPHIDVWQNVRFKVKQLTIKRSGFIFPFQYFPNIKSIVVILPYGTSDEQIRSIVSNNPFVTIDSFRVKPDNLFSNELFHNSRDNQDFILSRIFHDENCLKIFEYTISRGFRGDVNTNNLTINLNLHSLILTLDCFENLFPLIEFTPNLKYLKLHSEPPNKYSRLMNKINIKLKELHLKFTYNILLYNFPSHGGLYYENLLMDIIKLFSSSLICLSLDLTHLLNINAIEKFPFNCSKLQRLLEKMIQLKQFHLYARTNVDQDLILNQFNNQFWFDHNWFFGMHKNNFYTLPFHFDYLHNFPNNFNDIKSNHPHILDTNHRLWYDVQSIELSMEHQYDINFIKELKIKMPKLNFIKFTNILWNFQEKSEENFTNNQSDLILNNVTKIEITGGSIQQMNQWLTRSLPNVKHLILSSIRSTSITNQVIQNIERLDIDMYSNIQELASTNYIYYPNVRFIYFHLNDQKQQAHYENVIIQILNNFTNLKTLLLYPLTIDSTNSSLESESTKLIQCLNIPEINRHYRIKRYTKYSVFEKI